MKKIILLALAAIIAVGISAQSKMRVWVGDAIAYEQKVTQIDSVTFVLDKGALSGEFSVSPTKKVHFSKGNLQFNAVLGNHQRADGSTAQGTWRFAEHQWDMIFDDNVNASSSYSGWIDLFGWGTSGWNSGAVAYMPYSKSATPQDYYPGGNYTNNLTDEYAYADWGIYNPISNGGNVPGIWRTLTHDEWRYLFLSRENAASLYGQATVNGVHGLIILPDGWTPIVGLEFSPNYASIGWSANTFSESQWQQMGNAGAVFLPAGGDRIGSSLDFTNLGSYWSSTKDNSRDAKDITFHEDRIDVDDNALRRDGQSVRLVLEVENNPSTTEVTVPSANPFIEMINDSVVNIILPPDDEIWYTSLTNDTLPFPKHGGTIISNTYVNGKGIYKFGAPVTNSVFNCVGGFRTDTITDKQHDGEIVLSYITSMAFPASVTSLTQYGALIDLKYCQYLVFPNTLSKIGTDIAGYIGNLRDDGPVHVFFTSPSVPQHNWRALWNFPTNDGVVIHYPAGSNYDSLIQDIDEDIESCNITSWPHTWQPTTYTFK